jgi:8-oxo-dGTP pyrophosphatase MutT (NUDIX family)
MPMSPYMRALREKLGAQLVLMPGVTAIVRDAGGNVLLQRRRDDGRWGLPGGAIEPGEAPAQALVREVFEETGLRVRPLRVLGVFGGTENFRIRYGNGDVVEYTIVTFECAIEGGTLEPQDDESLELRFVPPAEVARLAAAEVHQCAVQQTDRPLFVWDESWLAQLGDAEA